MAMTAAATGQTGPAPVRDPGRRRLLVAAVAVPVVAAVAGGGYLATRPEPPTPVRMTVTLSPSGDGTLVRVTVTAERGRLPERITTVLAATDPQQPGPQQAGAQPGTKTARFGYTDLRLSGRRISLHDRAYSDELVDLPAGGTSFELSYRVGPTAGHRVVVLPVFRGTERRALAVTARGGRVLGQDAAGAAAGTDSAGAAGAPVRLELVTG